MPPDISKILADIYALDPSLRQHEAELTQLIQNLLLSKPDTKFDEAFARRLHNQLMSAETKAYPSLVRTYTTSMRKMMYTIFGSAAVVATALLITIFSGKVIAPANRLLSLSNQVKRGEEAASHRLAANAFGSLLGNAGVSEQSATAPAPAVAPTAGLVADSSAPTGKMMAVDPGNGASTPGVANTAMIMRPYMPYAFVYKGDRITLSDKTVDVYRRIKLANGRPDLAGALGSVSIGGVNLGSFAGSSLTSFELRQPTSDGYTLSVQISEGTMGISRSIPFNAPPVPLHEDGKTIGEQLPADADIIAVATAFLNNHFVNLSAYGTPIVENEWQSVLPIDTISARPQVAPAVNMMRVFMPQTITVLFPHKFNGTSVYDQGGSPSGITVNVSVQNKAVESVWGIQSSDYESSAYSAVTDVQKVLSVMERGGLYGGGHPTDAQVPVIELGMPERVLMVYYKYVNNQNEELLVPALRFPVTKVPDAVYYYQKSIMVPLVAELLDAPNPGPIMYMKGATGVSEPAVGTVASPPTIVPTPAK